MAGLDSTLHSKLLLAGYSDRNRWRRSRPPRREPNPRVAWPRSPDHGLPRRRRPINALFAGPDHSSSAFYPVGADTARSAIIVFHSGELRRIEKGKDDLFDAAAGGVSAVGIVTEVEWACDEAFELEVTTEPCRAGRLRGRTRQRREAVGTCAQQQVCQGEDGFLYPVPCSSRPEAAQTHQELPLSCSFGTTRLRHGPSSSPNTVLWRARRLPLPVPAQETALSTSSSPN